MAIVFVSRSDRAEDWLEGFRAAAPEEDIRVWPDVGDPEEVDIAVVAMPPPGELKRYPSMKAVLSLWAGVDALLADPDFPKEVPLVRMDEPPDDAETQHAHPAVAGEQAFLWGPVPISLLCAIKVVAQMVFQRMVKHVFAHAFAEARFNVAGWSRSEKTLPGVECLHGPDSLQALLARSEILVSLLPMTTATEGILDRTLFEALPKGAFLINAGRGPHLNEADLLAALDAGQVAHATLDVFEAEPLPTEHPFWVHPQIDITPHIASITQVDTGVEALLRSIAKVRRGEPLENVVDPARGY